MDDSTKLNPVKFGLATGIILGSITLIFTIFGLFGIFLTVTDLIIDLYGFFGYSRSWLGLILGPLYGFIDGFIVGWLFAIIYNKIKYKREI